MLTDFAIIIAKIAVVYVFILNGAVILTWAERKQSALISDRIGANRAAILGIKMLGLINSIADAIKMVVKEDFQPPRGLKVLHTLAPVFAMFPVFVTFAILPFGPPIEAFGRVIRLQILNLDIGILYLFAFGSIAVYGTMLAGWASNSKFSLMGGMRASAQMISYELILGLSLIGPVIVYGSLNPTDIVNAQNTYLWGWLPKWGLFVQPLAFLLFLPAAMAETKRAPFDLPEGESEIVAGYHTEYSGMRFGMFFLGEFSEIVVLAAVLTTVFFGGYNIPYLFDASEVSGPGGFYFPWGGAIPLAAWLVVVLRVLAFVVKVAALMWLQMQIRWTYPRFRYDQLMKTSWREMLPIALLNIAVTGVVVMILNR
jgi:NADH-quinone oxidoreductase subunit H